MRDSGRRRTSLSRSGGRLVSDEARQPPASSLDVEELEALRREVERLTAAGGPPRWNADPEDVQRSVARLVLTLAEFIRALLERQALRRMEEETLTDQQVEDIGLALMRLEEALHDMAHRFGLSPEELNLDLGPLGRLL
jgi:uncharacterized protein YjiS (DUF1127 family)